jgi:cyclic pyranopterin phosphate synthase
MVLTVRLDKTAKEGKKVVKRYCNLNCKWCHQDYFDHYGFIAISNDDYANTVKRVVRVSSASEAHVRLVGNGEPTMVGSQELTDLVVKLKNVPSITKVKLTTNGILLGDMTESLHAVGIDSITVSLNSLSREGFIRYSQNDYLDTVLTNISKAYSIGIPLKVNAIYWKYSHKEINDYEALSSKFNGLKIKFFDLLINNNETLEYYRPISNLEDELFQRGATYTEETWPYPKRTYRLPSGAVFEVKNPGQLNNCPNFDCKFRNICLEGCRHSVRIGLDGIMKPCGVRTDNMINLLDSNITDSDIWRALYSGGKIGYDSGITRNAFPFS